MTKIFSTENLYHYLYRYGTTMQAIKLRRKEKRLHFNDTLSIVAIAKNEGPYIEEWVRFHLIQGVSKIYLYDNDSPDNMKDVLKPYIDAGKVIYTFWPGKGQHLNAFNDAIKRFKFDTKYMAFIDVDEFLLPESASSTLIDEIESILQLNHRAGGIAVNWRMFGSSNHTKKPNGLVIENYLYRGRSDQDGNDCIKTIANPRFIRSYNYTHEPNYITGFNSINENGKIVIGFRNPTEGTKRIRLNHYFTKSKEEWIERRSRPRSDNPNDDQIRPMEEFFQYDENDVYDDIMLQYVDRVKSFTL